MHGDYKYQEFQNNEEDPYEVPKKLGIFKVLYSNFSFNTESLIERIVKNR